MSTELFNRGVTALFRAACAAIAIVMTPFSALASVTWGVPVSTKAASSCAAFRPATVTTVTRRKTVTC